MTTNATSPKDPVMIEISHRLKVIRNILDWNQRDMAKYLGLHQAQISNIEGNRIIIPIMIILRYHKHFNNPKTKEFAILRKFQIHVTTDWILTGKQAFIP